MGPVVVIDTNVFVSACLGSGSANAVLRACLAGQCIPLMGSALFAEHEDVLQRQPLWADAPLDAAERSALLDIYLSVCRWTHVYFGWRLNLPDEADNHLIELAVAGGAHSIVSRNLKDLRHGQLCFPQLRLRDPQTSLKELDTWPR